MALRKKTTKKKVAKKAKLEAPKPSDNKDTEALDWLIFQLKWRHMATDLLKTVASMRE